jgi:glutaredoxin
LSLIVAPFLNGSNLALAQESSQPSINKVTLYFFYGSTCPHCKKAEAYLAELKPKYSNLEIKAYEVFNNNDNAELYKKFLLACNESPQVRVPGIFINHQAIIGFLDKETTGKKIEDLIKYCSNNACDNSLEQLCQTNPSQKASLIDEFIILPIIGRINLAALSLPVLTAVIGTVDGFNPCSMWVLLVLISLLLATRSRKRMLLIGGIFILTEALFYFLMLTIWLNVFLPIGYVTSVRIIVGFLAIAIGFWQLNKFFKYQPGVCEVTPEGSSQKKKVMAKIEKVKDAKGFWAIIVSVAALALSVTFIDFFCSAGLPVVYTKILASSQLPILLHYIYVFLYVFFFMLDDLIVFFVALVTLNKIPAGDKYNRYSLLVGGAIILIVGFLLIFRPEWLMFA